MRLGNGRVENYLEVDSLAFVVTLIEYEVHLTEGKLRSQNDIDEQMHRKPGHNLSKSPTKNRTRRLGISINLTFRKEKGATEESEKGKGRST
ncbi:Hypothetical predicted protein [Olea europaea subsp. europaea]|uniref:Uncharacterized protein n=1 Tax=Olea europaea subsp. europaea TaxID=158383 RepID=A0A8S0PDZ3_OLEEU|nr:Hypothetical predicted protein [Olea europaea subsp. europaea]